MSTYKEIDSYLEKNLEKSIEELTELCKIPSVAAQNRGLDECAELVGKMLGKRGFEVEVLPSGGAPVVYAERKGRSDKTLLFYKEISDLGSKIGENPEIIRGLFEYDNDEDATQELGKRKKQILSRINKINKIGEQLNSIPKTKKHAIRRIRLIIQMRRLIVNLNIRSLRMDRIIDEIYGRLKATEQLLGHLATLNSQLKNTKSQMTRDGAKKQIKEIIWCFIHHLLLVYKKINIIIMIMVIIIKGMMFIRIIGKALK